MPAKNSILQGGFLLAAALGLALPGGRAQGGSTGITLKLDNADGPEIVAALSKASGVPIDWNGRDDSQRGSFDWNGVTLGKALREVGAKFHVGPPVRNSFGGGSPLLLFFGGEPPALPDAGIGRMQRGGITFTVKSQEADSDRSVRFQGPGGHSGFAYLTLRIRAELAELDAETVAGIAQAAARDDRGNLLVSPGLMNMPVSQPAWPDEWLGDVLLSGYDPRARKLVWFEGTLLTYETVQERRVIFPWPWNAANSRQDVEGTRVEFLPSTADQDAVRLHVTLTPPEVPGGGGPMVRYRGLSASLAYANGQSADSGEDIFSERSIETSIRLSRPAPDKVVVTYVECRNPQPRLSFRMTNIPLPGDPGIPVTPELHQTHPLLAQYRERHPEPTRPPFYDEKGGGGIAGKVEFPEKASPSGELEIGLSRFEDGHWSAVHWYPAAVSPDGIVKLRSLAPGRYRIERMFQANLRGLALPVGKWLNEKVTVDVVAGKETLLLPLRWVPSGRMPPVKSKPGSKQAQ